jgi:hypothetical protein
LLLSAAAIAGGFLASGGRLGSFRHTDAVGQITSGGGWHFLGAEADVDWRFAGPLLACLAIGFLCAAWPSRR